MFRVGSLDDLNFLFSTSYSSNMPSSFSSGSRTISVPGHDEYMAYLFRQQNPCFEQFERTPSPTPPPNTGVPPKPERSRSVKAIQTAHEPHQCALGLKCTRQINRVIYHKIKAIHLTAKAMQLYLPVNPHAGGDHTLRYYRNVCESLTEMLGWRRVDTREVLREIQSPEYWEAETEYLESPGCLSQRQKGPLAASTDGLSDVSSIEASDNEPPPRESSTNGSWQLRQQGGSGGIEVVADSVSVARHCPSQIPFQVAQPRARLSTSPVSNTRANSPSRSSDRKVLPTNSPRLKDINKLIASPNDSGEAERNQEYMGLGKRKSVEEMAGSDDIEPRKRRLCQARSRTADRIHRKVKRNRLIDASPPLEAITDSSQKHQRAENNVSPPVSRSRAPAVPHDRRRVSALWPLSAPTSTEYDHIPKVRQLQETRQLHRLRKPPLAQSRWDAVASRTRSKYKLDKLGTRRMLQT